jgi:ribosomal protein S18 acetylase RimI-like enzyme
MQTTFTSAGIIIIPMMIIRPAEVVDYGALCALIDQVDSLHRENLPDIFQESSGPARQREYILGLIAAENIAFFIAEQDERLVGFVVAILRMSSDIPILVPRSYVLIENLGVDRDYQGQGIGEALMERVRHWAEGEGARSIELTVYEFNRRARIFYESLGYRTESRRMKKDIGLPG